VYPFKKKTSCPSVKIQWDGFEVVMDKSDILTLGAFSETLTAKKIRKLIDETYFKNVFCGKTSGEFRDGFFSIRKLMIDLLTTEVEKPKEDVLEETTSMQ